MERGIYITDYSTYIYRWVIIGIIIALLFIDIKWEAELDNIRPSIDS